MKQNTFHAAKLPAARIAIVRARFHSGVTAGLHRGARKALAEASLPPKQVTVVEVPGSFDIPLIADRLAGTEMFDAIICLGAIVKGETDHDIYIAQAAISELTRISVRSGLPVTLGIITAMTLAQAKARSRNTADNRGYEAAKAAIELITVNRSIGT